ncbi:hypothetical protein ACFFWE_33040 [Sphaerisporangium melleum]|nr:hypothetical protein [Sphaerisporangium melleum]
MVKAMATRLMAAVGIGGLAWALGALALVVLTAGAVDVPTGISWT